MYHSLFSSKYRSLSHKAFIILYLTFVYQDAAINEFTLISAGTKSVTASIAHGSDFIIPVITPVTKPVGPYKLSIQPGRGSLDVAITVIRAKPRKIQFLIINRIKCCY